MQTSWAKALNPLLSTPSNKAVLLKSVSLVSGSNTINHTLGRTLQGWKIVRQRAAGSFFDTQDSNPMPELTLLLTSSATVVVDLEVF